MTRRSQGMDLIDTRAETVMSSAYAYRDLDENERENVRATVAKLAQEWAVQNSRTQDRRRFNERLVMSMLGVADAEEEMDVLWRMWVRPQRGHFS